MQQPQSFGRPTPHAAADSPSGLRRMNLKVSSMPRTDPHMSPPLSPPLSPSSILSFPRSFSERAWFFQKSRRDPSILSEPATPSISITSDEQPPLPRPERRDGESERDFLVRLLAHDVAKINTVIEREGVDGVMETSYVQLRDVYGLTLEEFVLVKKTRVNIRNLSVTDQQ
ncbi:hypothetical protein HDU83_001098 [Entophlyctis luteolus]|nr:hypothetical protein HDU82_005848 [Entophlyctis luteolus]KAJ3348695.1 hypothetical protein HDU83_001098 [Entophlyctis luteolus]KAJ3381257.1 hypothetical protein HDU84_005251 [Entophlyctis sp. JEL0112]